MSKSSGISQSKMLKATWATRGLIEEFNRDNERLNDFIVMIFLKK